MAKGESGQQRRPARRRRECDAHRGDKPDWHKNNFARIGKADIDSMRQRRIGKDSVINRATIGLIAMRGVCERLYKTLQQTV